MSIKEEIHALTDEMLANLGRLVAIDSQLGTPAEGMPFGEGPAKALEVGLKIAEELGFKTVNLDNYCGYAEMGEGDEIVGIAGHLDIVPAGGDWTHDPFTLTRDGDYVYGRGTTDDKGPVLEALYAMKLLRDSGVKLNKRVRLIWDATRKPDPNVWNTIMKSLRNSPVVLHRMQAIRVSTGKKAACT